MTEVTKEDIKEAILEALYEYGLATGLLKYKFDEYSTLDKYLGGEDK